MIDLHMHTKYSDGDYDVLKLIDILNENKITIASITDHNSIGAHIEYVQNGYDKKFKGKMITGVELQARVGDYVIDALVYNFDIALFGKYVEQTKEHFWDFHRKAYKQLLQKAHELGLKYIEPEKELQNGYYANLKFQDAINACYEENIKIVSAEVLTDIAYFYRHEFLNVDSPFYIDTKSAFPTLDEVIDNAHKCGAIVFVAHIDDYPLPEDKEQFLKDIIKNYDLDGIECFHPSISKENRKKYMQIARDNHLLISAGSDYHGIRLAYRRSINTEATIDELSWLKDII